VLRPVVVMRLAQSLVMQQMVRSVLEEFLGRMCGMGIERRFGGQWFVPPILQRQAPFIIAQELFDDRSLELPLSGFEDELTQWSGITFRTGGEQHLQPVLFDPKFLQSDSSGDESGDRGHLLLTDFAGITGPVETFVVLRDHPPQLCRGVADATDQSGSDGRMLTAAFLGIGMGIDIATQRVAFAPNDEPAAVLQQARRSGEGQLRIVQPGHSGDPLNIQGRDDPEDETSGEEDVAVG